MSRVLVVVVAMLFASLLPSIVVRAAEPATRPAPQMREWTFLGASVAEPTAEQRRQFELGEAKGALVNHTMEQSPAAKADIRAGDLITRAGDVDITSAMQLRDLIRARKAGDEVAFDLIRGRKTLQVKAILETRALPDRLDPPVAARRRPTTTTTHPSTSPSARAPWSQATDVRPEDLVPESYRVHPGDVLRVSARDVVGPGVETVKVVRVSAAGSISLPLVGPIHVAGMTEEEIVKAIDDEYRASNID
jgi:membrane-associated protease RseP (regulator of RpoE activity)